MRVSSHLYPSRRIWIGSVTTSIFFNGRHSFPAYLGTHRLWTSSDLKRYLAPEGLCSIDPAIYRLLWWLLKRRNLFNNIFLRLKRHCNLRIHILHMYNVWAPRSPQLTQYTLTASRPQIRWFKDEPSTRKYHSKVDYSIRRPHARLSSNANTTSFPALNNPNNWHQYEFLYDDCLPCYCSRRPSCFGASSFLPSFQTSSP